MGFKGVCVNLFMKLTDSMTQIIHAVSSLLVKLVIDNILLDGSGLGI